MVNSKGAMCRKVCTYICALGLLSGPVCVDASESISASLGLDLNATATVGLDEPTRALIANMPIELRQQTIELLKQALPLVDASVSGYMQKVNQIVDDQINHASCAALGSAKGIGDIFGSKVTLSSPTPVKDLDRLWTKKANSYGLSTSPHDIVVGYADFLANAAITSCEVASSSEAKDTVALAQTNARWRWAVWKRVTGKCSNPEACTEYVSNEVKATLNAANKADLQATNAASRFKVISDSPIPSVGLFTRAADWVGLDSVPIGIYEQRMADLFKIEDDILMSRFRRGQIALQNAQSAVDALNVTYEKERPTLVRAVPGCNNPAADADIKNSMDQALTEADGIRAQFASAGTIEPRLGKTVEAQLSAYNELLTKCKALEEDATKELGAMSGRTPGTDACKAHMGSSWPFSF
jgi:hypothetical protein